MSSLTDRLLSQPSVQEVLRALQPDTSHLLTGMVRSARGLLSQAMYQKQPQKIIWVTENTYHAGQLATDLAGMVAEDDLYVFETNDVLHAELAVSSPEAQAERIRTLEFLSSDRPGIAIIPLAGLRKLLPPVEAFQSLLFSVALGEEVELKQLTSHLVDMGYVKEQKVTKPGEFSVRGGIIDIYPITEAHPIRVELFGSEVDSLRSFDADTQRSIANLAEMTILPARDYMLLPRYAEQAADRFKTAYQKALEKADSDEKIQRLRQSFESVQDSLEAGEQNREYIKFPDLLYPDKTSVLDYVRGEAVLLVDEYPRVRENNAQLDTEEAEWVTGELQGGRLLPGQVFSQSAKDILAATSLPTLYFSLFRKGMGSVTFGSIHHIHSRQAQKFFGQMKLIQTEMTGWQKKDTTVIVMGSDEERQGEIHRTLQDFEIDAVIGTVDQIQTGSIQVVAHTVREGFELIDDKLVVLTEQDLFNKIPKRRARQTKLSNAERLKNYNELSPGDYVVHVHHGIGEYVGMETMEIGGVNQDYLSVMYKNNSKLFIPVTQLNLLQKYVASEGHTPKINKLGGTSWEKTKRKVGSQVEDIADDLIELYAERERQKGYAYPADNAYQKEFEAAFPYSETDDQLRSAKEIKEDLQEAKPMDRLLVGDVGYGKTEVALRAIFKVVQEGKQAAFLVPTTVLAQQHYETMIERFVDFPVEIGILSRFKTQKEVKETISQLKKGQLDVVVGTHRLLSKDIVFQDLGLLVVDEEQRFGVKHKERLKDMKTQVDVLTLTATPIPRTLHMSMLGVRDLSVIETPPANRYPVQTYVMEMNSIVIREAIEREMARGGQIFFLHNRVKTIERRMFELQELVPDARISCIHGQMTETELENRLFEFLSGEYDVIVTTTIIETGVDMPNVNTLIVEDADHMGLSQLYQLRGRVGRSSRVAYAYFMHQPGKVLTEVSESRLQAIKDFTELGSGFKIAMRDLAIRGAGNLLGKQQHGFIDAVGFDLYSQMLEEAVERKQNNGKLKKTTLEIDVAINAYLPSDYIQDERQKIELYKRIRSLTGRDEYRELQEELIDRFGEYDQEVADLLQIGLIKYFGERALIEKIARQDRTIQIDFSPEASQQLSVEWLFKALGDTTLRSDMKTEDQWQLTFKLTKRTTKEDWLNNLLIFTEALANLRESAEKEA